MNRSFTIIMIPVLLVALMYVLVLRHMGFPPGYPRLIVAMVLFFGMIWWLGRRATRKSKADKQ
jgi:preprotein translocase subunit YajC